MLQKDVQANRKILATPTVQYTIKSNLYTDSIPGSTVYLL